MRAITSTLTLVEVASAVRRSEERFPEAKSVPNAAGAFVRRALALRNLAYIPLGAEMSLGTQAPKVKVPLLFSAALKAARTLPLRTLDLVHIASAYIAVRLLGEHLDYFATLDEGILGLRRQVKEFTGCPTVTPNELVQLEGL